VYRKPSDSGRDRHHTRPKKKKGTGGVEKESNDPIKGMRGESRAPKVTMDTTTTLIYNKQQQSS
jgi:hypothetical protein